MRIFVGWRALTLGAVLFVLPLTAAEAADVAPPPGNPKAGYALAWFYCTECHVITRDAQAGWTDAPSFAVIADRPTTTSVWLQAFLQMPHMHMLNLPRSRVDAADIAAYILSLKRP